MKTKSFDNFYDNYLYSIFDEKHHRQLEVDKFKHKFEIENILSCLKENGGESVIDIGCGAGVNQIILSKLYGIKCTVIDRFEEFNPEHNRTAGDTDRVIKRLNEHSIKVIVGSYADIDFSDMESSFDVVTSFDVIEHLNHRPKLFLDILNKLRNPEGRVLMGTPNQQHIMNRIKSVFGKNTWEDFDIWFECENFYGHVRELLPSELLKIGNLYNKDSSNVDVKILSSNYPFQFRLKRVGFIIDNLLSKISSLSYYLIVKF
jgi:2-polyprenyl-3-methyl-5-hydroxy-6-metoxy-1,4-benzoquinol methylase